MKRILPGQPVVSSEAPGGFSLIEMVVVVSVVALLLALLLPSLSQARQRTRVAVCAAHQRQICIAMSLYATEFREYYPYMQINSEALKVYSDRLSEAGVVRAIADNRAAIQSIFLCPEYDMTRYRSQYSDYKTTYAVNLWVVGYFYGSSWTINPTRRVAVRRPERVPLIGDGVYQVAGGSDADHVYLNFTTPFEIGKYHVTPTRYDALLWLRYEHQDAPQAGFVDGHVEQRRGPWVGSVVPW
jgi:prepilin-type N-terminal cleavage/methylation domain-containing protein